MPSFPLPPDQDNLNPPTPTPQAAPEPVAPLQQPTSQTPAPSEGDFAFNTPSESAPPPPLPEAPQSIDAPATVPPTKNNPFKFILFGLIALIVLGGVGFGLFQLLKPKAPIPGEKADGSTAAPTAAGKTVTLTYWGIWEPNTVMSSVIDEFQKQNPGIKVNYQMQSHKDYRERVQTALQGQSAPDIVRFSSTWLPLFAPFLNPSPATGVTVSEIQANFYPSATDAVILQNQVFAAPTTLEGLALYVNESMFETAQLSIPKDWQEVRDAAKTLTQRDPNGNIVQSGIALGTTGNVDHWPDIVTLMLLQNGVDLKSPDTTLTKEALLFYSYFATQDKVWDDTLPSSVQAFAGSKVAMILAPSWRAIDIKTLNPSLKWKIYPVPQLPGATPTSFAHYWVEGVPKNSKNQAEAWKFIKFLASSQAQQLLFNTASTERGYGQAPANKALAERVRTNPLVGAFVEQGQYSKTFYTASSTQAGETSINSRLIKYLEDAVNSTRLSSGNADVAIQTLQMGFNQVLSQYGLVTPLPAVTP